MVSNREKLNISIEILKKSVQFIRALTIILYFGGTNIIFADCIIYSKSLERDKILLGIDIIQGLTYLFI